MREVDTRGAIAAACTSLLVLTACEGTEPDPGSGPPAAEAASSSSERLTLQPAGANDGAPLGYAEYLPPDNAAGDALPLLISLHGSDEAGDGTVDALDRLFVHGLPALIEADEWPDDRPFVVLMPQYAEELARACHLEHDIAAFIDFALDRYDIDDRRIYLTGVSCGATGAWGYLADHGDEVVAAAVVIAGRAVGAYGTAGCELGRVPLWVFHGEDDDIVPTSATVPAVEGLQECTDPAPVDVRLTLYPGDSHEVWDQTYDRSAGHDIYTWLLEHERS